MYKIRMEDLESIHKHLNKVEDKLNELNAAQPSLAPGTKKLLKENTKWKKYLKDNYFQDGEQ